MPFSPCHTDYGTICSPWKPGLRQLSVIPRMKIIWQVAGISSNHKDLPVRSSAHTTSKPPGIMTTILLALLYAVVLVQGCFPRIEDDPASNVNPKLRNQTGPPSTRSPLASGDCPQEAPDSQAWHVFVGVIVPDRAPSGPFTFSLCRGPHCIQAGGGAMYGSGQAALPL